MESDRTFAWSAGRGKTAAHWRTNNGMAANVSLLGSEPN